MHTNLYTRDLTVPSMQIHSEYVVFKSPLAYSDSIFITLYYTSETSALPFVFLLHMYISTIPFFYGVTKILLSREVN